MKIGFITSILEDYTYEEMIDTASALGFACVEAACWPAGGAERPDLKPCGIFLYSGRRIWIRLPLFYFVKNFTLAAQKFDNYRELEKRREIPIKV